MTLKTLEEVTTEELEVFSCGHVELDNYLKRHALNNEKIGYGRTFILEDEEKIVGFFTHCSASIKFQEFPFEARRFLPKYPIPCIKIARLGVEITKQGKGYGKELLKQAFFKILSVSQEIGVRLVLVDAKKESSAFYEHYGFLKLHDDQLTYYLSIDTLKKIWR